MPFIVRGFKRARRLSHGSSRSLHLTDELRERAAHQGVHDLPGRAVERAIKMGWLASEGVGAYRVLSRTSSRLPDMPQS